MTNCKDSLLRPNAVLRGKAQTETVMFIQNRKRGRVPWSNSLASMALNGGQHFAFGYLPLLSSVSVWRTHVNPALRRATTRRSNIAGSLKGKVCLTPSREA